eukprot:31551-Pelagococcus_subviridis.AAC.2
MIELPLSVRCLAWTLCGACLWTCVKSGDDVGVEFARALLLDEKSGGGGYRYQLTDENDHDARAASPAGPSVRGRAPRERTGGRTARSRRSIRRSCGTRRRRR